MEERRIQEKREPRVARRGKVGMRSDKFQIIENIEAIDIGSEGESICKSGDLVVFVKGLVPGDVADVKITKSRKRFKTGKVLQIRKPSPERIEAPCAHFGNCGGCKWQNLQYHAQLHYKQKHVFDALTRIAGLHLVSYNGKVSPDNSSTVFFPILGSEEIYHYRNRMDYAFSSRRWLTPEEMEMGEIKEKRGLGFHLPGMFDKIIDVEFCHLQAEPGNQIRNTLRTYCLEQDLDFFDNRQRKGLMRGLIIRNSGLGELMVLVMFGEEGRKEEKENLLSFLKHTFPEITSLVFVTNTKGNETIFDLAVETFSGSDWIMESMEGLKFRIRPKSFFQTNPCQALALYRLVREWAELKGTETVYDLYSGTGTIGCFMAGNAGKIVGVEFTDASVTDARENAAMNGISNASFFAGDMKKILSAEFFSREGHPDVIITDPPRAGMEAPVTEAILNSGCPKIIYVSCNPATQARDLSILKEKYDVVRARPVDMFPQTSHVENVCLLTLKK